MDGIFRELVADVEDYRYERKFSAETMMFEQIEHMLKIHPANFSEIYHEREVNNIYLDTHGYRCYMDNIDGRDQRVKVRIRWYGEALGQIKNPSLEIKFKQGLVGHKLRYPLPDFAIKQRLKQQDLQNIFAQADLPLMVADQLKNLFIALYNRYTRKYYLSFDKKFRITLDRQMSFYRLDTDDIEHKSNRFESDDTVIELKYPRVYDEQAARITNQLPFRVNKHSKYIRGIEFLQLV